MGCPRRRKLDPRALRFYFPQDWTLPRVLFLLEMLAGHPAGQLAALLTGAITVHEFVGTNLCQQDLNVGA